MAYQRPGVRLTQVFEDLAPALAAFALPSVHVGPAFHVVPDDQVGSYAGLAVSVGYDSQIAGSIVDLRDPNPEDLLDYPLAIDLRNMRLEWVSEQLTGLVQAASLNLFEDATANIFETVKLQDKIIVTAPAGVAGTYTVIEKLSDNALTVDIPFLNAEAAVTYTVERLEAGPKDIPRDTAGLTFDETSVNLPAGIFYVDSETLDNKPILDSEIHLQYRSQRFEISTFLKEYKDVTELQDDFGLDQIIPQNPVVYSTFLGLSNSVTASNLLEVSRDFLELPSEEIAFQKAFDVLKTTNMYAININSQNPVVHQQGLTHVNGLSTPDRKQWRVAIINRVLKTDEQVVDEATTSALSIDIVAAVTNGVNDGASLDILESPTLGEYANVKIGDTVDVTGGTNSVVVTTKIIAKVDDEHIQCAVDIATGVSSDLAYSISRTDGMSSDGLKFVDQNASFISGGVSPGMYIWISAGTGVGTGASELPAGRYQVASVDTQTELTFAVGSVPVPSAAPDHFVDIVYTMSRDLTLTEQAQFIADYTMAFSSRRLIHVWPDVIKVNVNNVPTEVPGYFLGSSVAALTTGLPTQQGFTRLSVAGYVGVVHSSVYFDDDELDIIAGGGSMVFVQARLDETPVVIRHQLTTDVSAIKFQEYSVTKNVDFISKFLVIQSEPMIGKFNIFDGLFDEMKLRATKNITFLRDNTRVANFGGVILSGSLEVLERDPANIDAVNQTYRMEVPIPLNKINITLIV